LQNSAKLAGFQKVDAVKPKRFAGVYSKVEKFFEKRFFSRKKLRKRFC